MSEHIPRLRERKYQIIQQCGGEFVKIKIALKPEINEKEKEKEGIILTIAVDSTGIKKVINRG
jgi:hypothetical protein